MNLAKGARRLGAVPAGLALALAAACGSGGGASPSSGSYNAATSTIVNASTHTGGTLNLVDAQDFDSADPGNGYYNADWDYDRLFGRSLVTYANQPGTAGLKLVPDLATSLGVASDGGKTWTYHIRSNVKFSDGQTITSADVKYAIERSNWGRDVLSLGPSYFYNLIDPKAATGGFSWPGPYKSPKTSLPDSMIATPDATTIVFHLQQAFGEFDYVAALPQTDPVPQAKDTGASYGLHPVSSAAYMVTNYTPGRGATLVKNPYWNPKTDPGNLHPQLVDKINLRVKVDSNTVDNELLSNQASIDLQGNGVQTAAADRILENPALKKNADDAETGYINYAALNTKVQPFTNLACRQAVEFGVNKVELQNQYGGAQAGDIATTVIPPTLNGYAPYTNPYATPGNKGDMGKAKELVAQCKTALGSKFTKTVNISARSDRPQEVAAATALASQLTTMGFSPTVKNFPSGTYFSEFAGDPQYTDNNHLGVMMMQIAPDWPDGYSLLNLIANGASIPKTGNFNLSQLQDPTIDSMIKDSSENLSTQQRTASWSKIDQAIMQQAAIVPILYTKAFLYRPPNVTNVFVTNYLGMYNYDTLGVKN